MIKQATTESKMTKAQKLDQRMRSERQTAEDHRYVAACDLMISEQQSGGYSDALIAQIRQARDARQARLDRGV